MGRRPAAIEMPNPTIAPRMAPANPANFNGTRNNVAIMASAIYRLGLMEAPGTPPLPFIVVVLVVVVEIVVVLVVVTVVTL